jgi:ubiquinone/menaquinone biosynthesis C-methylase UbiE
MKESAEKDYWETTTNLGEIKRAPDHPVVKFFSNQRIDHMKNFIDFDSIKTALDVGCGLGLSSFHFPPHIDIVGVDFSFRNLKLNQTSKKSQSSAYLLPFKTKSIDLVFGWDFLHHLEFPERAISEMIRVSKRYVVLFEPNARNPIQFLYGLFNKNERGTLKFNKDMLQTLVDQTHLTLLDSRNVGWVFAGASPQFLLTLYSHLPFSYKLGISSVVICEKIQE